MKPIELDTLIQDYLCNKTSREQEKQILDHLLKLYNLFLSMRRKMNKYGITFEMIKSA